MTCWGSFSQAADQIQISSNFYRLVTGISNFLGLVVVHVSNDTLLWVYIIMPISCGRRQYYSSLMVPSRDRMPHLFYQEWDRNESPPRNFLRCWWQWLSLKSCSLPSKCSGVSSTWRIMTLQRHDLELWQMEEKQWELVFRCMGHGHKSCREDSENLHLPSAYPCVCTFSTPPPSSSWRPACH